MKSKWGRAIRIYRALGALTAVSLLAAMTGCGGAAALVPPPAARSVEIAFRASADLNPDGTGRPSPVVVRIFVLKDSGGFLSASLDQLTTNPVASLADALLSQERQIVRPGESGVLRLKLDPSATHLGAVAEYRDSIGSQWRAVMAAPERKLLDIVSRQSLQIDLSRSAVTIVTTE
jgi:type VI secretion system protein VasD